MLGLKIIFDIHREYLLLKFFMWKKIQNLNISGFGHLKLVETTIVIKISYSAVYLILATGGFCNHGTSDLMSFGTSQG